MARELSDEELARRLESNQIDRTDLNEAARRVRNCDLRQLLHTNSIVEAIGASPLVSDRTAGLIEQVIMTVRSDSRRRQSSSKMSTLASKIWRTGEATKEELRSLAASVMSQDETQGQS